ncbi:succinyldiaminopimelate transaminase [Halothiobacillus diazotrophicus]|uniref:Succinyldiaminopimelate transaminase n=1 Tax=Halothiobacillus diazotrophicus TaxID=1860122 RepID=A0A191ZHC1_9GAMM|nr:succinyldiaminopimelate transaminase [Halothiobacillus diazotrophicus]ANJ67248.1 succinyldiaminopimelate transaminase [Halothiobacillus diazotrophicus]
MNPDLARLYPYPFEKLAELKAGITPATMAKHIALSIGEPQHEPPAVAMSTMAQSLDGLARYPLTRGERSLRVAIADWLTRRFRLDAGQMDPDRQVLPVAGTREALFSFAQAVIARPDDPSAPRPLVLMPNPFYQIYEGAAFLAGAEPYYYPTDAANGFLPDFAAIPEEIWARAQLIYVCSPGNPSGAVIDRSRYQTLLALADRHDVLIAADECYSEIFDDRGEAPAGLLEIAHELGRNDFRRIVVFHSLSKRSNLPGLRSGFVAGDATILAQYLRYRTYQGCALSLPVQMTSIAAWNDEAHVQENRRHYRQKFDAVLDILAPVLPVQRPDAGFYLWTNVGGDEREFCRGLFAEQNVTALPGRYLSRIVDGVDPGAGFVRMALVAELADCIDAAERIRAFLR